MTYLEGGRAYERLVGEVIRRFMVRHDVKSAFDAGFGTGTAIGAALDAGCETVFGIDLDPHNLEIIFNKDILPFCALGDLLTYEFGQVYDCVTCIEVPEHVAEKDAERLCEQLATACGKWLYWTAAPPEQPGPDHVNCQPKEYWCDLLAKAGFEFDADETAIACAEMREVFESSMKYLAHLIRNIQVFRRASDEA